MKFPAFRVAVDKLSQEPKERHDQLWKIYEEVREQAVHDLAEAVDQRDRALIALHRAYTNQPRETPCQNNRPKRGRPKRPK